mmetsp:Transcript_31271/g.87286  ORF Transcript_31271/g.87286 Transcript_31271/m.87286 type:complete len:89 (-) Transcript_31271:135-401(-)
MRRMPQLLFTSRTLGAPLSIMRSTQMCDNVRVLSADGYGWRRNAWNMSEPTTMLVASLIRFANFSATPLGVLDTATLKGMRADIEFTT